MTIKASISSSLTSVQLKAGKEGDKQELVPYKIFPFLYFSRLQ